MPQEHDGARTPVKNEEQNHNELMTLRASGHELYGLLLEDWREKPFFHFCGSLPPPFPFFER